MTIIGIVMFILRGKTSVLISAIAFGLVTVCAIYLRCQRGYWSDY
jgi:ABC-type enterobactin transport system permease subunit